MTRNLFTLPLIGLALLALAGCGTSSSPNDSMSQSFPFIRLSPSSPPPAPLEEVQVSPEPMKFLWRKGYWDYDGKQFSWVAGRFIERPEPTAVWYPDRWERRTFGWAFMPGYWR